METFMTEYAKQLEAAVRDYPQEYRFPPGNVPAVVARMRESIAADSFNKDSRAFKATCKALGIKHTYAAIRYFIEHNN